MKYLVKIYFRVFFLFLLGVIASACSSYPENEKKPIKHTHLENKCIDAITHSHVNGKVKHMHHYHYCETNGKKSNGHSHPSASITGVTRHVHANGAKKHTHGSN